MSDDILQHYGIKGMRWGIRRTQQQLKSLRREKEAASQDAANTKDLKKRVKKNRGDVSNLTNQELQAMITRMNLEKQYQTLVNPPKSKQKNEGRKFIEGILKDVARESIKKEIQSGGKNIKEIKRAFDFTIDADKIRLS